MKIVSCHTWLIACLMLGSGCASNHVTYDRARNEVANIWPGTPCHGEIDVYRSTGVPHLGIHGLYRDSEAYGIAFKVGPDQPGEFYFTVQNDDYSTRIAESQGTVRAEDGYVTIEVRYRDKKGEWVSPPINGRHRIDYPDAYDAAHGINQKQPGKAAEATPASVTPAAQEVRRP